ncbi:F-box only protein 48 isoform X2 [Hyperolius riggenbachi]
MESTMRRSEGIPDAQDCGRSYFFMLPKEVMLEMLSHLDMKSLIKMKNTCKYITELLDSYDILWKRHCMALRCVIRTEIDEGQKNGCKWQEILKQNYSKAATKKEWSDGRLSNISSTSQLPQKAMCPLSATDWGDIMDAEFKRDTHRNKDER